jgi:hypothetical protein
MNRGTSACILTQPSFQKFHISSFWSALLANFIILAIMRQSFTRAATRTRAIALQLSFPTQHACYSLCLGLCLVEGSPFIATPSRSVWVLIELVRRLSLYSVEVIDSLRIDSVLWWSHRGSSRTCASALVPLSSSAGPMLHCLESNPTSSVPYYYSAQGSVIAVL